MGGEDTQTNHKTVRGKMCTIPQAEISYGVDVFYHSLPSVLALNMKELNCNFPCLTLSPDEFIFIKIEEFGVIDNHLE